MEISELSNEGKDIVNYILIKLGSVKYAYRSTLQGCYVSALQNYNCAEPKENMNDIIDIVVDVFKNIDTDRKYY